MLNSLKEKSQDNFLVQSVHTAVKGRARYKINQLYHSKSLKTYLEAKLSQEVGIKQVQANPWTGNILIIFQPQWSYEALSLTLNDLVLNYLSKSPDSPPRLQDESQRFPLAKINGNNSNLGQLWVANGKHKTPSGLMIKMLLQKRLTQASQSLMLVWGAVSTLGLLSALLHTAKLDTTILLLIQKLHTPLFDRLMLGLTFLGDPGVVLLICLGLILTPSRKLQRSQKAITLAIATVGAVGLNYWLKVIFGRVRPALWKRLINVGQHSFPSGHAMVSIVTYGLFGYLLAREYPQWRGQIWAISLVLILGIGFSRLYLGVHWPTDVLAGYAVGLVWLSSCILGWELWLEYRNNTEEKLLPSP